MTLSFSSTSLRVTQHYALSLALRDRERARVGPFPLMIINILIGSFVFFFSDLPSKHPSVKSTRKQIASLHVGFFSPCCTANHSLMTLKMYTIVITALNYYLETVECVTSRKNISVLKGLQDYIGNVLWPSELSQKKLLQGRKRHTFTRQYCVNGDGKSFLSIFYQPGNHNQGAVLDNRVFVLNTCQKLCVHTTYDATFSPGTAKTFENSDTPRKHHNLDLRNVYHQTF